MMHNRTRSTVSRPPARPSLNHPASSHRALAAFTGCPVVPHLPIGSPVRPHPRRRSSTLALCVGKFSGARQCHVQRRSRMPATSLLSVAQDFEAELNNHDLDRVVASFTEDAVITFIPSPPPTLPRQAHGKAEI